MIQRRDGVLGWVAVATFFAVVACESEEPLPKLGTLPEFVLVDHHGDAFDRRSLLGRVTVASFVFTRCPSICPLITERTRRLQEEFDGTNGVHLVSFSVDPAYDTPAVLQAYRRRYGAKDDRWSHVTGSSEVLRRVVVTGFKTALGEPEPAGSEPGFDILHSSHFILVDTGGTLRGFYRSSDPGEIKRLVNDVHRLL